jgi:hypothetical protein
VLPPGGGGTGKLFTGLVVPVCGKKLPSLNGAFRTVQLANPSSKPPLTIKGAAAIGCAIARSAISNVEHEIFRLISISPGKLAFYDG